MEGLFRLIQENRFAVFVPVDVVLNRCRIVQRIDNTILDSKCAVLINLILRKVRCNNDIRRTGCRFSYCALLSLSVIFVKCVV